MGSIETLASIPVLGSGIGYRHELKEHIYEHKHAIDFVEIIADQFTGKAGAWAELAEVCSVFPVIPHGIGLSVGSATPLDGAYLRSIKAVSDFTEAPYYSDHLCMTRAPGIDIGHLSPLWLTEEVLATTIRNVQEVQDSLGKPLVLENITYLFDVPAATMTEPEFFSRLVEATGCGVLLDVTNVHINSVNHHFEPIRFLREMPLQNVVQVHLAGGFWSDGILVDGHSERVDESSWGLFSALAQMAQIKGCIVEQDANFPEDLSGLLEDVTRAREVLARARPSGMQA